MCLLVLLAGCYTPPDRRVQGPLRRDWSPPPAKVSSGDIEEVPEPPQIAPPPVVPQTPPPHTNNLVETWVPLKQWSQENGCLALRQIPSGPATAFVLAVTNGVFVFRINSTLASWNGIELLLGFDPRLVDGQPYLHSLDLKKNVEPLLHAASPPRKPDRVIVIDPGHGGQQAGTVSVADGRYEKEFTLDWARRISALLSTNGWRVFLTRTNDSDIALSNRVAFAEQHKADLFISLHFNSAAPNQEQAGLETYCLTPVGMPSTLTREYVDDVSLVFPNNAFDAENLRYAVLLHRSLLAVAGTDHGVRHARFLGVLRGQNRPAILIEGGYLSNPREARRIGDPAYRQKLAEAVARTLAISPIVRIQRSESAARGPIQTPAPGHLGASAVVVPGTRLN